MSKFNTKGAQPSVKSPMATTAPARTHEGGLAWSHDDQSALLLLAVTNMVGESTFYESASARDARFRDLVRKVAVEDYGWMHGFVLWLRTKANMRSASVVAACEAVKARLDAKQTPAGRTLIDAACQRADEPGELLSYWTSHYGRKLPKPVKRGVADAVRRLYNGKNLLRYDSDNSAYRFGDVIDLVHPSPADDKPWQGELFRYALDRRHNRSDVRLPEGNKTLAARQALMEMPVGERRKVLLSADGSERLAEAGMTWESLAGWLQGPMDAKAWEAIIPSMGAFALMRNLRNFDEAKVSDKVAAQVCEKLSNPEDIRKARVFPYRLLSAYRAAPSLRWGHALDKGLDAACGNLPEFSGSTLVLVDTSGSMLDTVSEKSKVRHVDVGALFGVALAMRGNDVELYGFAGDGYGNVVFPHNLVKGGSALKQIDSFCAKVGTVGHGTKTVEAVRATFRETIHKRVVIISDMQTHLSSGWGGASVSNSVPRDVPVFGINTSGYASTSINTSDPNRFEIGGFSDAMFTMMDLLSRGRDAGWPWEIDN